MSDNRDSPEPPSVPQSTRLPHSTSLTKFEDSPDFEPHQPRPPEQPCDDGNELPYPEPSSEQALLPPPNFKPFFTLIEDTISGEHYHPHVHYVFADDDPVILTAASMRSLGLDDAKYLPQNTSDQDVGHVEQDEMEGSSENLSVESPLPPPVPGVREHYLIVDLGADGQTIVNAQSLSPEWQITETSLRTAPSFDESSPDQGYMLRIEGIEVADKTKGKGKGQAGSDKLAGAKEMNQGDIFAALDGLVQDVERGLTVAAKLVGRRSEVSGIPVDVRVTESEKSVTR